MSKTQTKITKKTRTMVWHSKKKALNLFHFYIRQANNSHVLATDYCDESFKNFIKFEIDFKQSPVPAVTKTRRQHRTQAYQ